MPGGIVVFILLLLILGLVLGAEPIRSRIDPTMRQVIVWVIIAGCVLWLLRAIGAI